MKLAKAGASSQGKERWVPSEAGREGKARRQGMGTRLGTRVECVRKGPLSSLICSLTPPANPPLAKPVCSPQPGLLLQMAPCLGSVVLQPPGGGLSCLRWHSLPSDGHLWRVENVCCILSVSATSWAQCYQLRCPIHPPATFLHVPEVCMSGRVRHG